MKSTVKVACEGLKAVIRWSDRDLEPKGRLIVRVAPSVVSWLIAATAGIAATLLAAYLQGWQEMPSLR